MKKLAAVVLLAVLFAVQLWAAITIGTTTVAADTDGNGAVTTSAIDTSGASAVALAVSYFEDVPTITDSKSNTWVTTLTAECESAGSCIKIFYFCGGTVGSGHTFTASGSAGDSPAIIPIPLNGTLTASCIDGESAGGNTAGPAISLQGGSLTPSQDNSVVISAIGFLLDHGTATINGSFNIEEQLAGDNVNYDGVAAATLIQTTAAAANPTWSWDNGIRAAAVSAAFKVDAGGGAVIPIIQHHRQQANQ